MPKEEKDGGGGEETRGKGGDVEWEGATGRKSPEIRPSPAWLSYNVCLIISVGMSALSLLTVL